MYDTVSQLIRTAFIGLGNPEPELMTQSQLAEITYERLCFYYEQARASDQNLTARKTAEFSLDSDSNEKDITALVAAEGYEICWPLWMERKTYAYNNNPTWIYVDVVNTDTISDRRVETMVSVSYYGDIPTQVNALFSIYGNELLTAQTNLFRLWYAPQNVFSSDINSAVAIPGNLTALVVVDVKIQAFAQMQVEAAKYIDKRPELAARMKAWDRMTMQLMTQKVEWTKTWNSFINRSRSYHRAVNHIDVLGQEQALNNNGRGRGGWW